MIKMQNYVNDTGVSNTDLQSINEIKSTDNVVIFQNNTKIIFSSEMIESFNIKKIAKFDG